MILVEYFLEVFQHLRMQSLTIFCPSMNTLHRNARFVGAYPLHLVIPKSQSLLLAL